MNDESLKETFDAALTSIHELTDALIDDHDGSASERIYEDALSVEVRPPWYRVGDAPADPEHYRILLTTGGPAVRIVGELNSWLEPETAELEVQDWFKPWSRFPTSKEDDEALMQYVSCFAFA